MKNDMGSNMADSQDSATPGAFDNQFDNFVVNSVHIGEDTIQFINEAGECRYYSMTERCQQDRKEQTEAFGEFMKDEGRREASNLPYQKVADFPDPEDLEVQEPSSPYPSPSQGLLKATTEGTDLRLDDPEAKTKATNTSQSTTSINEILEQFGRYWLSMTESKVSLTKEQAKTALYTLIASVRPKEKKLHPKLLNTDEWLKAEAHNQALQDYDRMLKELFNGK